jgi:hypothetical protein
MVHIFMYANLILVRPCNRCIEKGVAHLCTDRDVDDENDISQQVGTPINRDASTPISQHAFIFENAIASWTNYSPVRAHCYLK